jgi:MFS family permease
MNRYQWTVLFAAWLGWGFDVFDGLLFNFVAPNCVPTLLGLPIGTAAAKAATLKWGGILTSMLLLGWSAGGILFGRIADRIGRKRTLLLTMLLYALGTAACAGALNIWMLMAFRVIASLGIGGEWAAGAAMVAEVVPEKRRVEAGALLYTSAPAGLFLATFANSQITGVFLHGAPETSWRFVFLCGLIPAAVAFIVRTFVREPERWNEASTAGTHPRIAELFTPEHRRATLGGFAMAVVALITWWSVNAFITIVVSGLAHETAAAGRLDPAATSALVDSWIRRANYWFNWGGLFGTLLTIPAAKVLGRRAMFGIYYALSAVAVMAAFGLDLAPTTRINMYFFIGLTVFGVFGSFTYYLPELFPTRLRGTGAGFCYNIGRVVAAAGPFLVGTISARGGANALAGALHVLFFVGFVPILGVLMLPLAVETKGREFA